MSGNGWAITEESEEKTISTKSPMEPKASHTNDAHELENLSESFHRHFRCPLHLKALEHPNGKATGVGSCGDIIEISLCLEDDAIVDIGHSPRGCAFTVACASAVCDMSRGLTVDEALRLSPEEVARKLGGLPEDHLHCARLAVNTLGEAIADAYKNLSQSRPGEE